MACYDTAGKEDRAKLLHECWEVKVYSLLIYGFIREKWLKFIF